MKETKQAPCSECGGEVRNQLVKQEFEREGMRVEVAGIRALVCQRCGEIYFAPGGAQAVVEAANGLFALAKKNRQHKGKIVARTIQKKPKKALVA
jgi:YgiT-type zinc finger domain-containing protein